MSNDTDKETKEYKENLARNMEFIKKSEEISEANRKARLKRQETCKEKQKTQTLEERMAPYIQLIEKFKSEAPRPIYEVIRDHTKERFQTREEYAEYAAVLAFFEEYELLERYIKEGAGSQYDRWNFMILNQTVTPEFDFREPSPLYFITIKEAWEKMKDPKKMLDYLIKKYADVNVRAGDDSTPLLNQIINGGSSEIIRALLERRADVNCLDSEGNTPLSLLQDIPPQIAKNFNYSEVEELLLEHGALFPDEMEEQDDDGRYDGYA